MNSESKTLPVTAVIVHFRTFDLTKMSVWSLKSFYPDLRLIIIDNNSRDGSLEKLQKLQSHLSALEIIGLDEHIHHGPGMDKGIHSSNTEWVLVCDTDCIVYRPGVLESMLTVEKEDTYMIGEIQRVDKGGFPARDTASDSFGYVHPFFALVRREKYFELPPFEKHGAPCLKNEFAARQKNFGMIDFPVRDYVYHFGRGTVNGQGYGLGFAGQYEKLKKYYRRLTGMFR